MTINNMTNDKGISVEKNLQETIASNIKALHKKRGCKTAGGRRIHRRVRKNPLFNRKQHDDGVNDGVDNVDGGVDDGGDNKRPVPKVTGLAQLKNLEKQVQDLQKDMSSMVDKSMEELSEDCGEECGEGSK